MSSSQYTPVSDTKNSIYYHSANLAVIVTADFNANHAYRYYQAYGWAQARFGGCSGMPQDKIQDMAAFYDDQITDDAWNWYRINYLMHKPFAARPSWEQVAGRLGEILDDPALIVEYIGIRDNGSVDKTSWCKVGHTCNFILTLLYERIKYEDLHVNQNKKKNNATKAATETPWAPTDRWAAAHVLYSMLGGFQDDFAVDYRDRNHSRYVIEYRAAEKAGDINDVIKPCNKSLTPEQYQAQLLAKDASFLGRVASYFRAMA